jgi:hypothetical protein
MGISLVLMGMRNSASIAGGTVPYSAYPPQPLHRPYGRYLEVPEMAIEFHVFLKNKWEYSGDIT